jgi:hypothetical protein
MIYILIYILYIYIFIFFIHTKTEKGILPFLPESGKNSIVKRLLYDKVFNR